MAFISGISGVKRDGEMKKNMMVFWICLLLGILSMIYAVMVHATGSGTAFFLIWIGIGIVVFLFGISVYMEVWKKVPHPVKIFAGMIVCIGLLVFCIVEGCVISQMHADGRGGLDYIIVLGAQVRKDGPSPVLKYRLDKAVEYMKTRTRSALFPEDREATSRGLKQREWHGICRKKELILRGFCRKINRRQPGRISRTVKS